MLTWLLLRAPYRTLLWLLLDCCTPFTGQAAALQALGRGAEAMALWERTVSASPTDYRHSVWRDAPPQASQRHGFVTSAARARVALGDLAAAEELLLQYLAQLGREVAPEVSAEHARCLEVRARALMWLPLTRWCRRSQRALDVTSR